MKILVFSDIHGDVAALHRLMAIEADYYFAAGDLSNFARSLDTLGPVLAERAGRVHVLPGNHESAAGIRRFCERYGLHDFHGRTLEIDGVHVAGLGYSNPTPFNTPGEYTETQLAEHLQPFKTLAPLVLICHCPPRNTPLDQASPGRHFGSASIADFLAAHPPLWFFCGHIHEAAGQIVDLGPTRAVNAGKEGYLLDFANLKTR